MSRKAAVKKKTANSSEFRKMATTQNGDQTLKIINNNLKTAQTCNNFENK